MQAPVFREGVRNRNREAFIAQLQREAPLYRDEAGFWVVSRLQDAREVLRDHGRFSSDAMGSGRADARGFGLPLLTDDPPRHTSLRGLVSKAFSAGRIAQMRPAITALAQALVAGIEPGREVDIVRELAVPLQVTVIARMMGIPEADRERFKRWSDAVTGLMLGLTPERAQAVAELREYFLGVWAQRRAAPADDLISALTGAHEEGVWLSDEEIVGFSILLLVAGNETTTNLLGSLLHRMAAEPAHWHALRANPGWVPRAIEQGLRLDAPAQFVMRRACEDTTLSGHAIAKGEMVLVYLGAVNRDPGRWAQPELFGLAQVQPRHIAFGFGVHTCIGAPLARLEAEVALRALLRRFEHIELGQGRVRRLPSGVLFGYRELPVVLR